MEKHVKIVNAPDYVRDTDTGAVILANKKALDKYLTEKQRLLAEKKRIKTLENEVTSLRNEIDSLHEAVKNLQQQNCGKE